MTNHVLCYRLLLSLTILSGLIFPIENMMMNGVLLLVWGVILLVRLIAILVPPPTPQQTSANTTKHDKQGQLPRFLIGTLKNNRKNYRHIIAPVAFHPLTLSVTTLIICYAAGDFMMNTNHEIQALQTLLSAFIFWVSLTYSYKRKFFPAHILLITGLLCGALLTDPPSFYQLYTASIDFTATAIPLYGMMILCLWVFGRAILTSKKRRVYALSGICFLFLLVMNSLILSSPLLFFLAAAGVGICWFPSFVRHKRRYLIHTP